MAGEVSPSSSLAGSMLGVTRPNSRDQPRIARPGHLIESHLLKPRSQALRSNLTYLDPKTSFPAIARNPKWARHEEILGISEEFKFFPCGATRNSHLVGPCGPFMRDGPRSAMAALTNDMLCLQSVPRVSIFNSSTRDGRMSRRHPIASVPAAARRRQPRDPRADLLARRVPPSTEGGGRGAGDRTDGPRRSGEIAADGLARDQGQYERPPSSRSTTSMTRVSRR